MHIVENTVGYQRHHHLFVCKLLQNLWLDIVC
jgi:hypothetical protein